MFGVVALLCAIAAVIFSSAADERKSLLWAVASYALATSLLVSSFSLFVQANQVAVLLVMAACYGLLRPNRKRVLMAFGGLSAAYCSAVLSFQGVPIALALAGPAAVLLVSGTLARSRPNFVSEQLRDEATAILLVFAIATALLPAVMDAWRSAAVFQAGTLSYDETRTTRLVMTFMAVVFVFGALYQWRFSKR